MCFFCFKQKTAYEMRISDWSSDVCSSDLGAGSRQDARLAPLGLPSGKRQAATAARSALRDCPVEEGGDAVQRDIAGKEGFADAPGEQERKLSPFHLLVVHHVFHQPSAACRDACVLRMQIGRAHV